MYRLWMEWVGTRLRTTHSEEKEIFTCVRTYYVERREGHNTPRTWRTPCGGEEESQTGFDAAEQAYRAEQNINYQQCPQNISEVNFVPVPPARSLPSHNTGIVQHHSGAVTVSPIMQRKTPSDFIRHFTFLLFGKKAIRFHPSFYFFGYGLSQACI